MNKKWGQGQLFAFSGLDGKTDFKNDLVGTLSADRISIIFHTEVRRELAIVGHTAKNITFSAVTGDYINVTFDETHNACFVFYKNGVVVGSFPVCLWNTRITATIAPITTPIRVATKAI